MKTIDDNNAKHQSEAGFTLIEAMIALAVVSIILLSIASTQTSSVSGNTTARLTSEASTYAVDQMERLLNLPFADAGLNATAPIDLTSTPQRSESGFGIWWSVENNPGGISNTKRITVTVSSDNRNMGARRNVTLISIKSLTI